jgi:hypothetical protein
MSGTWKDKKVSHVQGLRRSGASGLHKNKVKDRQRRLSHDRIWKEYIKDENE